MFVPRCYFYIKDNRIIRQDFDIEWSETLSYEFKNEVVSTIESIIPTSILPAADVTSSSQYRDIRDLSVFKVKSVIRGVCFYDYWKNTILATCDKADEVPGAFSYVYLCCLGKDDFETILRYNCYYDIYFNPEKKFNSLALTFIALKLLIAQNKLDYLQDMDKFMYWYYCNVDTLVIKK